VLQTAHSGVAKGCIFAVQICCGDLHCRDIHASDPFCVCITLQFCIRMNHGRQLTPGAGTGHGQAGLQMRTLLHTYLLGSALTSQPWQLIQMELSLNCVAYGAVLCFASCIRMLFLLLQQHDVL
jgi:hypothetical protein